jgi:pSer/pThr/pTyr-binding forkhead associated (FHA) protein
MVEGHTIRFYQPLNGTLQLLPGRLEVVEGEDRGQNIRFVRTGGGRPEITFGRTEGPPHRHVQLRSPTVSREHARMQFEGEEWRITNMSRTNPVVVNGEELDGADGGRPLREGDRVEMGDVTFVFRTS